MDNFNIFEAVMMICFGASWPFSLIKTIRVKNPTGKSLLFMSLVLIGYICGLLNKIPGIGHYDHVLWIYVFNTTMVATDFVFTLYYARRLKLQNRNGPGKDFYFFLHFHLKLKKKHLSYTGISEEDSAGTPRQKTGDLN